MVLHGHRERLRELVDRRRGDDAAHREAEAEARARGDRPGTGEGRPAPGKRDGAAGA